MKYDLLQLAWIVMAVITAYTGGKKDINSYKNTAFWGCIIMSNLIFILKKLEQLL